MIEQERQYQQLRRWAKRLDMRLYKFRRSFWLVDAETNGLIQEFRTLEDVYEWFQSIRWAPSC